MWRSIDKLLRRGRSQGSNDVSAGDFHFLWQESLWYLCVDFQHRSTELRGYRLRPLKFQVGHTGRCCRGSAEQAVHFWPNSDMTSQGMFEWASPISVLPSQRVSINKCRTSCVRVSVHMSASQETQPRHRWCEELSPETAIAGLISDILLAPDTGDIAALALLDLSASFDMVDDTIVLQHLRTSFGLNNAILSWFCSYLDQSRQNVCHRSRQSAPYIVQLGMLQVSVVGPLLFMIYTADVNIIKHHSLSVTIVSVINKLNSWRVLLTTRLTCHDEIFYV